jgi:hypothetical protein
MLSYFEGRHVAFIPHPFQLAAYKPPVTLGHTSPTRGQFVNETCTLKTGDVRLT